MPQVLTPPRRQACEGVQRASFLQKPKMGFVVLCACIFNACKLHCVSCHLPFFLHFPPHLSLCPYGLVARPPSNLHSVSATPPATDPVVREHPAAPAPGQCRPRCRRQPGPAPGIWAQSLSSAQIALHRLPRTRSLHYHPDQAFGIF